MKITIEKDEYWYGLATRLGSQLPFHKKTNYEGTHNKNMTPNQTMPLLVSTQGRYIYRKAGLPVRITSGNIEVPDDTILVKAGDNLRDAYLTMTKKFFPFNGSAPHQNLFEKIIYNTWIELTFSQEENAILQYCQDWLDSGVSPGVLMIDDGWATTYGDWTFHPGKIPHPDTMITKIKQLGFDIMLWICPFVSADSVQFRYAQKEDFLIKTSSGDPLIVKWWNGYSAVLDMTHPKAIEWLTQQLDKLLEMGIDGFKFDAGDSIYYTADMMTYLASTPDEQSQAWAKFGQNYQFNEYRVTALAGGMPLLQRLCDKHHSWDNSGIASIIPDTLALGLLGSPFSCPDMIGGGEYLNFQDNANRLDQELFIRHAEMACFMPAMQFSAMVTRVLDEYHLSALRNILAIRERYLPYILELVEQVSQTGEPIVRYMSYEFPDEAVEMVIDQYMLGSRYLVAPIIEKGASERKVYLPKGKWQGNAEQWESNGAYVMIDAPLGNPIILEKIT